MNARTKLRWVDVPPRSLREGLACGQGGVQILLMMGEGRRSVRAPDATSAHDGQADTRPAEKPH